MTRDETGTPRDTTHPTPVLLQSSWRYRARQTHARHRQGACFPPYIRSDSPRTGHRPTLVCDVHAACAVPPRPRLLHETDAPRLWLARRLCHQPRDQPGLWRGTLPFSLRFPHLHLSQVLALWLITRWSSAGSKPFRIVELGPGRGTLMADMLRVRPPLSLTLASSNHTQVIRQFPPVRDSLDSVHLVETSPAMRALQRTTLETPHARLAWHDALDEIPYDDDRFTMLVAHEFFDALPVHVIEVRPSPCAKTDHQRIRHRKRRRDGTKCSLRLLMTRVSATPGRPLPSLSPPRHRHRSSPRHRAGPACSRQHPRRRRRSLDTPRRALRRSPSAHASKSLVLASKSPDRLPSYFQHRPAPVAGDAPSSSTMGPRRPSVTRCACVSFFPLSWASTALADPCPGVQGARNRRRVPSPRRMRRDRQRRLCTRERGARGSRWVSVPLSCSTLTGHSHTPWDALAGHVSQRSGHPTARSTAHQGCAHRGEEDGDRRECQSVGGSVGDGWAVRRARCDGHAPRRACLAIFTLVL